MSCAAETVDFSQENTLDVAGHIMMALDASTAEPSFQATVPEHLSEECVAHWDGEMIW